MERERKEARAIWLQDEITRLANLPVHGDEIDDRINDLEHELEELEKELGE